jgi:two-component system, sensor histidine kinase ChiS
MRQKISPYILFLLWGILSSFVFSQTENKPQAVKGTLDLTNWNFDKNGTTQLNGRWEFYWQKLLTPANFDSGNYKPDYYMNVPYEWVWEEVNMNGKSLSHFGFATYRLNIKFNNSLVVKKTANNYKPNIIGLRVGDIHSAYSLWINNRLYVKDGNVSSSVKDYRTELHAEYVYFPIDTNVISLVVNAANFNDIRESGIDFPILIGSKEQIFKEQYLNGFTCAFSFGILLITAVYHFMLYVIRTKEKTNLYFSGMCFLLAFDSLCVGDKPIFFLFPFLTLEQYFRIWFMTAASMGLAVLFYSAFLPRVFNKTAVRISNLFWIANIVLLVVLPVQTYHKYVTFTFYLVILSIVFIILSILKGVKEKREYSVLVLIGVLIPFSVGINDMLNGIGYLYTGYYLPFAFIIYIVIQSYVISLKFSKSFKQVEDLSHQLEESNIGLEKRINERTEELQTANAELSELNASKDRFFSIISHDLRGPFQAFLGFSEILHNDVDKLNKEDIKSLSGDLHDALKEQFKLLTNLLDWSRLQTNRMPFNPDCNLLYDEVTSVVNQLKFSAINKEISINNTVDRHFEVYADKSMLHLVIRNIISNSIKFTHHGGAIFISAEQRDAISEICIADNGVGMAKEKVDNLFKIGHNISTKGTSKEKGTGLGLILCRDIIEKHNGKIRVESELDEGSKFIFTFPRPPFA